MIVEDEGWAGLTTTDSFTEVTKEQRVGAA